MIEDPIVEEVRRYRNEHAAQYDNDETVCQSKVNFGIKTYLLRVFINFTKKSTCHYECLPYQ